MKHPCVTFVMQTFFILTVFLLLPDNSKAQSVNVMSYNLRLDTKAEVSINGVTALKVTAINQYHPDLLGV